MYLPEIFSAKILVSNSVAIIDKLSQLPSVALPNNVSKIISFENNRVNTFERIDQANTNLYSDQKNSFDGSLWARSADLAEFNVPAAIADGVTDCTAAIQQAINAAKINKRPVLLLPGVYVVTASNPNITYGNQPDIPIYRALDVNGSNIHIIGYGSTILLKGIDNPSGQEINYVFSSAKNMSISTLVNFTLEGITFDFNASLVTGEAGANYRSMHLIGFRGITIRNCSFVSSGARAGATITLQNSEQVMMNNLKFNNITQGMNFSYINDVQLSNIIFDNFSEAIDFDRKVSRIAASNIQFISTGAQAGQCWDLNSVSDAIICGVTAKNCGNVLLFNYKNTTPETYAEYVAGTDPINFSPSKNISVSGIHIDSCGSNVSPSISVQGATSPGGPCKDIIFSDFTMHNSGAFEVYPGDNIIIRNGVIEDCLMTSEDAWGAIYIRKSVDSSAYCSGIFENIKIKRSQGNALRIAECNNIIIRNFEAEDWGLSGTGGTSAIRITSPSSGDLIDIENVKFQLSNNKPTYTGITVTSSSGNPAINIRGTNLVSSNVGVPFQPSVTGFYYNDIVIPTISITSGATKIPLLASGSDYVYLSDVVLISTTSIAANNTNYINYVINTESGTISSGTIGSGATAVTAGSPFSLNFVYPEALATVEANNSVWIELTPTGSGRILDGSIFRMQAVKYRVY